MDAISRLVYPLYRDPIIRRADLRTYKTVRFVWLFGIDGYV